MCSLGPRGLFSSLTQQSALANKLVGASVSALVGCYCRPTSGALLQRGCGGGAEGVRWGFFCSTFSAAENGCFLSTSLTHGHSLLPSLLGLFSDFLELFRAFWSLFWQECRRKILMSMKGAPKDLLPGQSWLGYCLLQVSQNHQGPASKHIKLQDCALLHRKY